MKETGDSPIPTVPEAGSLRLFVSVELSSNVVAALAKTQRELKEAFPPECISWTRPESLHLTLRFLGDVPAARLADLVAALAQAVSNFAALELKCEQLGCFPERRPPRVLWAGVHEAQSHTLEQIRRVVSATCDPFAGKPDDKPFTGHVTLGRFRRLRRSDLEQVTRMMVRFGDRQFGNWIADEVVLFRSELRPEGAKHSPVARLPLRRDELSR